MRGPRPADRQELRYGGRVSMPPDDSRLEPGTSETRRTMRRRSQPHRLDFFVGLRSGDRGYCGRSLDQPRGQLVELRQILRNDLPLDDLG